jgi:hypothetical protein
VNELSSGDEATFPDEYSVAGWFRWSPTTMSPWHLAFRVHINKGDENSNASKLGDRTLALWASPLNSGIYAFATYTYTNLNGAGNANVHGFTPYGKEIA